MRPPPLFYPPNGRISNMPPNLVSPIYRLNYRPTDQSDRLMNGQASCLKTFRNITRENSKAGDLYIPRFTNTPNAQA